MSAEAHDAEPIALETLARLSGCAADKIETYAALGLIGDGGAPGVADVTGIRLIESLETAGISAAALAEAVRAGVLSFGFPRSLIAFPITMSGRTYGAVIDALDLDPAFARAAFTAAGLPPLDPERPAREDDVLLLTIIARAQAAGVAQSALLRILRVFGHTLRRLAEAQRDLFRIAVEEPLIAAGAPVRAVLEEGARRRVPLQRLGFEASQVMLRRFLEDLIFENVALRLQSALTGDGLATARGARHDAIGFADIAGYTDLMRHKGDLEGAETAARFEALAQDVLAAHAGRIIKALGDGLLIHFREPTAAPRAAAEIVARAAAQGLPPIHVGLAAGPIIFRDGDMYGTTVNRAARLAAQARPGSVLADEALRRLCADLDGDWRPVTLEPLKGLPDLVAFAWRPRASPAVPDRISGGGVAAERRGG